MRGDQRGQHLRVPLDHATQLDIDLVEQSRRLFHDNWTKKAVRLLGQNGREARVAFLHDADRSRQLFGATLPLE